ncbi:TetR/AcrR family transcriptional regulator [Streptomyces sp. XM83C]|uniref:TetR/AcrR family transcriptional regulator n=1 Tax=Streptomyces thermocoprophilus TaxID=78356 RepID=A0ABV5V950_9ACTN|nr:TetR/AcrR family transcriptional regulator [Streptomyces sp. XM83C]MCK1821789.1 TetR/AcrR family transcriptional regulator [Streptomyces sp. XM83C]
MGACRTARERARDEITASIKEEARRQLAATDASQLSVRALARELGMVSSAVYRYFSSRDELLTALIRDAYDALGEAAEHALDTADGAPPAEQWTAVCRAVREWALTHPHEYALIYGSPIAGYAAPADTVASAERVGRALIRVVAGAAASGTLDTPPDAALPDGVAADAERLAAQYAPGLGAARMAPLVAAWAQLFGLVGFEVFGQFHNVVTARDAFFDHACTGLARQVGLRVPQPA